MAAESYYYVHDYVKIIQKLLFLLCKWNLCLKLLTVDYTKSILFTIYGDTGEEQLVLSLGRNISLLYNTNVDEKNDAIFFDVDISDGEWHRLGISIKGDAVTIILDCDRHITKKLQRNREKMITGIFMIGQQLRGGLYLVRKKIAMIITQNKILLLIENPFFIRFSYWKEKILIMKR